VAATAACLEDLGLAAASEEAYTAVINMCAGIGAVLWCRAVLGLLSTVQCCSSA
jgi:hypothetical protein